MVIEVVVFNIESAIKAQEGWADRVELCDNPEEGGTTPSYGIIELVRQHLSIDVYVMIRPRGGDFLYSIEEFHAMRKDIETCKKLSVDGVVFGMLKPDGTIDKEKCKKLITLARPMKVTCHRAFDMTLDPFQALEDCIEAGFDRILTSGQQPKAIQGIVLISELIDKANGRIVIMAGSDVNEENVGEIVSETRINEVHVNGLVYRESGMRYQNPHINGFGSIQNKSSGIRTVDSGRIRITRERADRAKSSIK